MTALQVVKCSEHLLGEPGKQATHWHIEVDGERTDARYDTEDAASADLPAIELLLAIFSAPNSEQETR